MYTCPLWRHKWLLPTLLWGVERVKGSTGLLSHSWWLHWQCNTQIIAGKHSWWFIVYNKGPLKHIRQGGKWVNGLISSRWGCRPHSLPSSGPLCAASACLRVFDITLRLFCGCLDVTDFIASVNLLSACQRKRRWRERNSAGRLSVSAMLCVCCPTSA